MIVNSKQFFDDLLTLNLGFENAFPVNSRHFHASPLFYKVRPIQQVCATFLIDAQFLLNGNDSQATLTKVKQVHHLSKTFQIGPIDLKRS